MNRHPIRKPTLPLRTRRRRNKHTSSLKRKVRVMDLLNIVIAVVVVMLIAFFVIEIRQIIELRNARKAVNRERSINDELKRMDVELQESNTWQPEDSKPSSAASDAGETQSATTAHSASDVPSGTCETCEGENSGERSSLTRSEIRGSRDGSASDQRSDFQHSARGGNCRRADGRRVHEPDRPERAV